MFQYTLCIFVLLVAHSLQHAIPRRKQMIGRNIMFGRMVDRFRKADKNTTSEGELINNSDHRIKDSVISSNNVKHSKRSVDISGPMNVKQSNPETYSAPGETANSEFVNRVAAGMIARKAVFIDSNSNFNFSELQSSLNESTNTRSDNTTTGIKNAPSNGMTDKLNGTGVEHRATGVTSKQTSLGNRHVESGTTAATSDHKNETVNTSTDLNDIKLEKHVSGPLISQGIYQISDLKTQKRPNNVSVTETVNGNMPEGTKINKNIPKIASGQQNFGLSAESLENMAMMIRQNSKTTNCSEQCSPFWLSALSLSLGQLPPNHSICNTGNFTSCSTAQSVCAMEPTKIVCCPMECLGPLTPCYKGPEAQNMCIPIDVTHWLAKLGLQGR